MDARTSIFGEQSVHVLFLRTRYFHDGLELYALWVQHLVTRAPRARCNDSFRANPTERAPRVCRRIFSTREVADSTQLDNQSIHAAQR